MSADVPRRYFAPLVLCVGVWAVLAAPLAIGSDGLVRFASLDALLRRGTLDRSKYSMYGLLAAAPLWYLGEAIGFRSARVSAWRAFRTGPRWRV